jgi:RNA polymerase sigma factor (sigma-70 family)
MRFCAACRALVAGQGRDTADITGVHAFDIRVPFWRKPTICRSRLSRRPEAGDNGGRGVRDLFEILTREHIDSVRAFLLSSLRDQVAAEDLVQEAFLVAWRILDRYDRQLPFGPWVRGIAGKLLLNHRRKLGRTRVHYCDDQVLGQIDNGFSDFAQLPGDTFDEQLDALRDCLGRLNGVQRESNQSALRARSALQGDRGPARPWVRSRQETSAARPRDPASLRAQQAAEGSDGVTKVPGAGENGPEARGPEPRGPSQGSPRTGGPMSCRMRGATSTTPWPMARRQWTCQRRPRAGSPSSD